MRDEQQKGGSGYLDVADALLCDIRSGRYAAERPFPSLTAIMRRFGVSRADNPAMFMSVTGFLPMGSHYEDKDQECHPRAVHFTDFASAGNEWSPANRYRAWLPALIRGRTY